VTVVLRAGDVIAYTPATPYRRDGYAIVRADGTARDTYSVNDTRLTDTELATAHALFSLDEFEEQPYIIETDYRPEDVHILPTHKGTNITTYLRRGAQRLPESQAAKRADEARAAAETTALAALLAPDEDKALALSALPKLTIEETRALIDTVQWVQRASRQFKGALQNVILIQRGDSGGRLDFAIVHADDDLYELVRARRALNEQIAELRG